MPLTVSILVGWRDSARVVGYTEVEPVFGDHSQRPVSSNYPLARRAGKIGAVKPPSLPLGRRPRAGYLGHDQHTAPDLLQGGFRGHPGDELHKGTLKSILKAADLEAKE